MGIDIKVYAEVETQNEDRRWLGHRKGTNSCRPITLDSSAFVAAHLADKGAVPSGTFLSKLPTGLYGPYGGTAGVNEVQRIAFSAGTDGGTFTIDFDGAETAAIAWDATTAQVQAALELLANVDIDDIVVSGTPGVQLDLTFGGQYKGTNVPVIVVDDSLLTDGGIQEDATITTQTSGVRGADGLLFSTTKLGDGTGTDLATAGDVAAALFWEGIVKTAYLPVFSGTNAGEIDADARTALTHIRFED